MSIFWPNSFHSFRSICFIKNVSDFLLDLFPDWISAFIYILYFDRLFDNIDNFASSDQALSSNAFDSDTKQSADPFVSVIIDALDFNVSTFELKDLSSVLDFDFEVAFVW